MTQSRRLSDRLIDSLQKACDAHNELLAAVLREAANIELAGVYHSGYVDRRPSSSDFRRALTHHARTFRG